MINLDWDWSKVGTIIITVIITLLIKNGPMWLKVWWHNWSARPLRDGESHEDRKNARWKLYL